MEKEIPPRIFEDIFRDAVNNLNKKKEFILHIVTDENDVKLFEEIFEKEAKKFLKKKKFKT